jgi:hypothetical protein
MNVQTSLASQRSIKALARAEPSVLLPAHDPDAATRIANRQCTFDTKPDAKGVSNNVANNAKANLCV